MKEKSLELERLVFFSDAIVAIAITLLVFDLKITKAVGDHFTFSDLALSWQKFVAFFLSFFIIAIFWKIHHEFFTHIREIDNKLLWFNIFWLMFIVTIPFATSLLSSHFFDKAAIFTYSFIVLMVTIFQNNIWDYVANHPVLLKENQNEVLIKEYRIACNLAMFNALLACTVSFLSPIAAFLILVTRLPMFGISARRFRKKSLLKAISKKKKNQPQNEAGGSAIN
jgi:uncharacterized membrane protein